MSWITLVPAGLFEIGWAVGLKFTDGFSRPLPSALAILAMLISLGLLGLAMKDLPLEPLCDLDWGWRGDRRHHSVWRNAGLHRTGRPHAQPLMKR